MWTASVVFLGESVGVALPDHLLSRLGIQVGDVLLAEEAAGGILLKRAEPELLHQLEVAASVMRDDREALRMLAQSDAGDLDP